jgi:nicotinate phosphoribosyltransferase
MQCAILKYFPNVEVEYTFTNRTPHMRLNSQAIEWLKRQFEHLENLQLQKDELEYLQSQCPYLDDDYLNYLKSLRLRPKEQVELSIRPANEPGFVDIDIRIQGLWVETILYEIPILALTSEAYFRFVDTDWSHDGQEEAAYQKGVRLLQAGCEVSEFGSRRRRDFHTQDLVMSGLTRSMRDHSGAPGKLVGTSNVYFAMKHGVPPIGTVAHEWYMAIAAINDDYENANELGLKYWLDCYGEGVLGIALTDTFGTPNFYEAFKKPAMGSPRGGKALANGDVNGHGHERSYATMFTGIRQDSGDPKHYVEQAAAFYDSIGIKGSGIIFSDSLNVEKCIEYKQFAESYGFKPSFGVGTFFTNDFRSQSNPRETSKPLNIVIKVSKAQGNPCVKISDNINKNTGDKAKVKEVKVRLGYEEIARNEIDETKRW